MLLTAITALALVTACATSHAAEPLADELAWNDVGPLPEPTAVLDAPTYLAKQEALLARIGKDEYDHDGPSIGLLVDGVHGGSTAQKIGLRDGSLLLALDGVPIRSAQHWKALRGPPVQRLRFWTRGRGIVEADIPAGLIGIGIGPLSWSPLRTYWMSAGRRPAEERDAMTAIKAWVDHDVDLAETALARLDPATRSAGIVGIVAASVAQQRGDDEGCWRVGHRALRDLTPEERTVAGEGIIGATLVAGRYRTTLALLEEFPTVASGAAPALEAIIDQFAEWDGRDVLAEASERTYDDAADRLLKRINDSWDISHYFRDKKIGFSPPAGGYQSFQFGPEGRDIDLEFSLELQPPTESGYPCGFYFGVCDVADGEPVQTLQIAFDMGQDVLVQIGGLPGFQVRDKRVEFGTHRLRLIALGRRFQALLDGELVFSGPLMADPARRRLGITFQGVGTTGYIRELALRIIGAPDPAHPGESGHVDLVHAALAAEAAGDLAGAEAGFIRAAELGDSTSRIAASDFYLRRARKPEAVAWRRKDAELGDDHAWLGLALFLASNYPEDPEAIAIAEAHEDALIDDPHAYALRWKLVDNGYGARLLPIARRAETRTRSFLLVGAFCALHTGEFKEALRIYGLPQDRMWPTQQADLAIMRMILAAMYEPDHAVIEDREHVLSPEVSEGYRLALDYLEGKISDARAEVSAAAIEEGKLLFYYRAFRNVASGRHAEARADFALVINAHPNWRETVTARALLAWYDQQTEATLKALPVAKFPAAADDANDAASGGSPDAGNGF